MEILFQREEPYGDLITNYFNSKFPTIVKKTNCDLVEILSQLIIGTKEVRYGSLPNPEHLVNIRKIISYHIDNENPIPVLVPWGSIKSDFSGMIDIAEISAIRKIIQLAKDVKEIYFPGLEIRLRLEDTSGYSLFSLEANQEVIKQSTELYVKSMRSLINILEASDVITIVEESKMIYSSLFEADVNAILPTMIQYLTESESFIDIEDFKPENLTSFRTLKYSHNWKGVIPREQRNHYYEAYKKLYPNWNEQLLINRLALYLTGSLVRHKLDMTGSLSKWNNLFLQLSFVPPIKGLPYGYNHNYIYYRTLSLSQARTHMPPWRAKGYLKISGNDISSKITSFQDVDILNELIPSVIKLYNNDYFVDVKVDYFIEY